MLGQPLPPDKDPLRRVRAWQATAEVVEAARARLLAEGKPVFIVVHHYGITGLLSFYLPEARPGAGARAAGLFGSRAGAGEPVLFLAGIPLPETCAKARMPSLSSRRTCRPTR